MTPQELYYKSEYEGGLYAVLEYCGPKIFECLGPEAVELASAVEDYMQKLHDMLDQTCNAE